MQEGCLSVPGGFYEDVKRIEHCRITARDRDGKEFVLELKACWQFASSMKWTT